MIRNVKILVLLVTFVYVFAYGSEVYNDIGVYDFNFNWKFILRSVSGAEEPDYDDSDWENIDLPHDWSIYYEFDSNLEGCTGYLPGGVGWYRKEFTLNIDTVSTKVFILFDGVYNNSKFWINGKYLGEHIYGYSPFYFDVTPYIIENYKNVISVLVDRQKYADSRWYSGSGIYRSVKLIIKKKVYVPIWGAYIRLKELSGNESEHILTYNICNESNDIKDLKVNIEVYECHSGKIVYTTDRWLTIKQGEKRLIEELIKIKEPLIWDIEHPYLYQFKITLFEGKNKVDEYNEKFGIRTYYFDADKGFFLNGRHLRLKGVCLHHDGGLIGAAMIKGVWERRLEKLKEMGCNAIRISHNPAATEFLDLCDSLGFLVIEEFFDEWDYPKDKRYNTNEREYDYITEGYAYTFQSNWKSDIKNTILRDRNRPSIIMWSIGNEIEWTYPIYKISSGYFDADWHGNYFWNPPRFDPKTIKKRYKSNLKKIWKGKKRLEITARALSEYTKNLDPTRLVTANLIFPSVSLVTGYADVLDVVGFSYRRVVYAWAHKYFPNKPIIGSENVGQWHEWKAILEYPFVGGMFVWTGIDYLGEATNKWPIKGSKAGFFDTAGFEKPSYHMFRSLWNDEPYLYIGTQELKKSLYKFDAKNSMLVEKIKNGWERALWVWHDVNEHWNYETGDSVVVEIYSNCEEVELFLNEHSIGRKRLEDFKDHIYKWMVSFSPGTLVAAGYNNGNKVVERKIITSGKPYAIKLDADKESIRNDGYDVVHVVATIVDSKGVPVKDCDRVVRFRVDGPGEILGVDNGSMEKIDCFRKSDIETYRGRCLLIVKSIKGAHGVIKVKSFSDGITSDEVEILYKKRRGK